MLKRIIVIEIMRHLTKYVNALLFTPLILDAPMQNIIAATKNNSSL